jgi:hypothetical protein
MTGRPEEFHSTTPQDRKKSSQGMSILSPCEAFGGILALILKRIALGVTKYAMSFPQRSPPWLLTTAA